MTDKSPATTTSRDYGFLAIVGFVVLNAIWLLLMPVVPSIASATLHRFHLRSRSFALWAIQQPIPSMYNFANRYEVRDADGAIVAEQRYINHFPVRVFTFANRRVRYLRAGEDRWFRVESTYQGQTLRSEFHAKAKADGRGYDLIRLTRDNSDEESSW